MQDNFQLATLSGGCFWCTEAVFKRLKGVESVMPGYSGGEIKNPSYQEVSSGNSGHAEAVQIKFDPKVISFERILDVFWALHDPTTLNRQGADVGPQYRSAIFYHDEDQRKVAEDSRKHLADSGKYKDPIVTEITKYSEFYPAEQEHLDFYDRNRTYGYCRLVIDPKIQKLYKDFKADLKEAEQH